MHLPGGQRRVRAAQGQTRRRVARLSRRVLNHLLAYVVGAGIVGFGNFGQFLAKRFVKQGHRVRARRRKSASHARQPLLLFVWPRRAARAQAPARDVR